ncbi:MAG: RNA-binding domain-containing protein [Nanoarchaeota archaeon]
MRNEVNSEKPVESQRKVRFILLNIIRILLVLIFLFAEFNGRKLLLFTSIFAFIITFMPWFFRIFLKKEPAALFDIIIILFVFGLFTFWEIRGVYASNWIVAFLMTIAEAIALGLLGLTLVHTLFKNTQIESNPLLISGFSFCLGFTFGALLEITEVVIDSVFKFRIHEVGLFNPLEDLGIYLIGSLIVALFGYFSLKRGKQILISSFLEDIIEKNSRFFGMPSNASLNHHEQQVREMIKKGEGNKVEFKSTLRKNLHTNACDKQIEHASLKTINAYLNSDGGTLLIGVSDNGEILGLDVDQFANEDHAHRHLMQLINDNIGAEFLPLIRAQAVKIEGKSILKVDCKKSEKEAFVKVGKDEHFYVRQGSLSMPLTGSALLKYVEFAFRKKE